MSQTAFRDRVLDRAARALVVVHEAEIQKLEQYYLLLARWNRRINLTSLPLEDFPDATIDRLLIEPLIAAPLVEDTAGSWLDLGSGGGSPAIPLKVAMPHIRLFMVEPRARKTAFLREAVRTLELPEVQVLTARAEELESARHGAAALVTIRAVRLDDSILTAASVLLKRRGRLLLFGSSPDPTGLRGFQTLRQSPLPSNGGFLTVLEKHQL